MGRLTAMVGKEVKTFLSDPQQLFFSFALPLLILAVFVGTFSNVNTVNITGYVVDLDASMPECRVRAAFLLIGWAWFRVFTPASFGQIMVFTLPVVSAGAALGMFIASIARSTEQAIWGSVILSNLMAMLGGSFTPIPADSIVGKIARFTPNHYANQGFKDIIAKDLTMASPAVWSSFRYWFAGCRVPALWTDTWPDASRKTRWPRGQNGPD